MSHPSKAPTLAHLFKSAAETYHKRVAFATRQKSKIWKPTSFEEIYEAGHNLSTALIDLGVEAREHVGILADNRLEWIIADCAVQLSGAADVPRGIDVTDSDIQYILPHADVKVCFIENLGVWKKIEKNKSHLDKVKTWILMDPNQAAPDGVLHMNDLIKKGAELKAGGNKEVESRMQGIKPDDLCTVIYTSGTTGAPKGVMLQHSNILCMMDRIPMDLGVNDRVLSLLPIWHIFERAFEMFTIYRGAATYYTNVRNLGDDLKNVQPTYMGSAPRLWESLYIRILDGVQKAHPVRRFLFHTAYGLAQLYKGSLFYLKNRTLNLTKPNPVLFGLGWIYHAVRWLLVTPLYGFFNVSVLERIRQGAGASLKATVSGGGALPLHVDRFFNMVGISVLEGYGMTETSPLISARSADNLVIGTVGPPAPGTDLRVVDLNSGNVLYPDPRHPDGGRGLKGEIHVRGDQVMRGYYKNQEATDKVLDKEGWMNTGDIGMMTFNNCLKIMGRSKDTIVLASGENVEPVPIENKLVQSSFVDQVIIVGQDEKFMTALVVPSVDGFKDAGIEAADLKALSEMQEAKDRIGKEIKSEISADNGFKSFERVPDFRLLPAAFEVGEELTNLHKLKRHIITEKYKDLIAEMYSGTK